MWSSKGIPILIPALATSSVARISSLLGVGSLEGWLWINIIDDAFLDKATLYISLLDKEYKIQDDMPKNSKYKIALIFNKINSFIEKKDFVFV